jgi:type III pantothenate kinase
MNLIIDVGNSAAKVALFERNDLRHSVTVMREELSKAVTDITFNYKVDRAILSNVGHVDEAFEKTLKEKFKTVVLNAQTAMPFNNAYTTPETLGVDRMGLAAAAVSQYPEKPVLVIDAGSCITYDYINENGTYLGGAISPGVAMRYKSLYEYTAKLPKLDPSEESQVVGDSTVASMHSGVIFGIVGEIDARIDRYRQKKKDLTVVLTGGDVNFLANKLKNSIFANPIFLLEGLNSILVHNIE